jgi:hypothetical protein
LFYYIGMWALGNATQFRADRGELEEAVDTMSVLDKLLVWHRMEKACQILCRRLNDEDWERVQEELTIVFDALERIIGVMRRAVESGSASV